MKFILLSFLLISIHSSYAQESILVTGSKISKPDAIKLSDLDPSTVDAKLTLPPVKVLFAVKLTASPKL